MSAVPDELAGEVGLVLGVVAAGTGTLGDAVDALAARPDLLLDLLNATPDGTGIVTELVARCVTAQPTATFGILLRAGKIEAAGRAQVEVGGRAVKARLLETVWRLTP